MEAKNHGFLKFFQTRLFKIFPNEGIAFGENLCYNKFRPVGL